VTKILIFLSHKRKGREEKNMFKKLVLVLTATVTLSMGYLSTDASAASKRAEVYRGSWLAWSRDYVEWYYNGSTVSSSSAWQDSGWVFPNIVRENGIHRYYKGSTLHKWRAEKSIAAGVPTPWADVTLYTTDVTDYIYVRGSGSWSVY
jgi:hypothetical protein